MLDMYWNVIEPGIMPLLVEEKFEIQLETFKDVIIY